MPKFEVELSFTQHSRAKTVIEADSLEAAQEKADEIQSSDIDDWNPFDGEVDVHSVIKVKE